MVEDLYDILVERSFDLRKLSHDCIAAAAERMRGDYADGKGYNPADVRIVLGDPCVGVSMPCSCEEALEMLRGRL